MLFRESETVELKEVVVDDIKKEIIAFETTKNAFKIILPNINAKYETENATVKTKSGTPVTVHTEKKLSDEEDKILEYARKHGAITRNDVIGLLEVSASTAARVIRKMVKTNLLEQKGKARNTHYTIAE